MPQRKKTSIVVSEDLWYQLSVRAAIDRMSFADAIEAAITLYLHTEPEKTPQNSKETAANDR